MHVLSAPPAFVLSQDQTLHEFKQLSLNEHVCVHSEFSRLRPVLQRTRRTCCLRLTPPRGARLSTPKDPSCQLHREPLARFHSHPASFTRPPRQSFNLSPSTGFVKGAREPSFEAFRLAGFLATPSIYKHLGVSCKGSEFRTFPPSHRRRPFKRQPYKLSAFNRGVNPRSPTRGRAVTARS